jgi:hypothetical protein
MPRRPLMTGKEDVMVSSGCFEERVVYSSPKRPQVGYVNYQGERQKIYMVFWGGIRCGCWYSGSLVKNGLFGWIGGNMLFDVDLRIKDIETDISTEVNTRLNVELAPSGRYIAWNPLLPKVAIGSGESPRLAVLEYLGNLLWHQTVEAEMATSAHESKQ